MHGITFDAFEEDGIPASSTQLYRGKPHPDQASQYAHLQFFLDANWMRWTTPVLLKSKFFAGLTNAAIVLPQGVAFAPIAELPPNTGSVLR